MRTFRRVELDTATGASGGLDRLAVPEFERDFSEWGVLELFGSAGVHVWGH
jgi:hypothetical protein